MWRITHYIPRVTLARGTCVRSQTINSDEELHQSISVVKSQQRGFSCKFNEKNEKKKKQEERGADREWFRQHVGPQHTFDAFGYGSAVVLGLQFGHLCHLYMQQSDVRSHCPAVKHNADAIQHPLCLYQLAQTMPKQNTGGLLLKSILPAKSTPAPSTKQKSSDKKVHFVLDALTTASDENEVSAVKNVTKRSLLDDLVFPYGEVPSTPSPAIADQSSTSSSTSSFSCLYTSSLSPSPSLSSPTPSSSATAAAAPYPEFSAAWTSLCRQYLDVHGNEEGRALATSGDLVGAFASWQQTADDTGYSKAQFNTALCYETGQGVKKNIAKAAEYYALAAGLTGSPSSSATSQSPHQRPHAVATYNLALLYLHHPHLLATSTCRATPPRSLLEKAAELGVVKAMRALGQSILQEEDATEEQKRQALQWLHKAAAEHEDAESQYYLGHCYWHGVEALPTDLDAALEYFEMALKNGYHASEEHISTVKEEIHKQRLESLLESLHRCEGPGPPSSSLKVSQSSPSLSQSFQRHLLEMNLTEWDSGFSSPTEFSMDMWASSIVQKPTATSDGKIKTSRSSSELSELNMNLGEDTINEHGLRAASKDQAVYQIGENASKHGARTAQVDLFSLSVGGFGDTPLGTSGKTGKIGNV